MKNIKIFLSVLFFASSFTLAQYVAEKKKLYPVDESSGDKSFLVFRDDMLSAISRKDSIFLINHLDENIFSSIYGEGGIKEFRETWDFQNPDTKLWQELETIFNMGGKFFNEGDELLFEAPYTSAAWPKELEEELFDYSCVIDSAIFIYKDPSEQSEIIEKLSYDIVKVIGEDESHLWTSIETYDNKKGFVRSKHIRSPLDYRIGIAKRNNIWKLIWFVAGD